MTKRFVSRVAAFACICAMSIPLAAFTACSEGGSDPSGNRPGGDTQQEGIQDGYYVLSQKTVEGYDTTDGYLFNCLHLSDEEAVWYETDYTGRSEREGTVEKTDDGIVLVIGVREYEFVYDASGKTLTFSGKIDRQDVTMRYTYDENYALPAGEGGGVSFTDELFGEDKSENFYNYCPTAVMEGNDTMHVWYCSNKDSGNVTDYVAYRKGTLHADGKWEFTEKKLVLEHGANGEWDSRHVCDPSVIRGTFRMGGEDYSWLMAYLGCETSDNTRNEVGIAVAKSPEGPWVKVESLNPIANFYESEHYSETAWGFGQPSLVSSDGAGKVLLFYAMGAAKTCTVVEEWDFSDLDAPEMLRKAELRERGVTNASGSADCINNADFAYDPARGRLYCIKEDFPYPTDGGVSWITGSNTLLYLEVGDDFDLLFGDEPYVWNRFAALDTGTGHARNHNAGIIKDGKGNLIDPYRVPVLYTAAQLATDFPDWNMGGQWPSLHTYRIHGIEFTIR